MTGPFAVCALPHLNSDSRDVFVSSDPVPVLVSFYAERRSGRWARVWIYDTDSGALVDHEDLEGAEAVRFWSLVDDSQLGPGGCWLWKGVRNLRRYGYGTLRFNGATRIAHRVAYELTFGPIPAGLTLDHVWGRGCHHTHCVNTAHLEPLSLRENILRGSGFAAVNAGKTHCPNGHPLSGENLSQEHLRNGRRVCRECRRAWYRARGARRRLAKRRANGLCVRWGCGFDACVNAYSHIGPCRDEAGNTTTSIAAACLERARA